MAIDPSTEYPGQVITTDSAYPYGKPRNRTSVGDTSGTPLEAKWVGDLWGFLQSLLSFAAITPSGNPDEVGTSDYLDALKYFTEYRATNTGTDGYYDDLLSQLIGSMQANSYTSVPFNVAINENSRFTLQDETNNAVAIQTDVTDVGNLIIPIALPYPGMKLVENGAMLSLEGSAGHSAVPATPPAFALYKRVYSATTPASPTLIDSAADTEATAFAYNLEHEIQLTFAEENIDPRNQYFAKITGETGTGAVTGTKYYRINLALAAQ